MTKERAGVIVVRGDRLALIERVRQGRRYWVVPGGGVEANETTAEAARREGEEELGVPVQLGALRVRIDHREEDGSFQRQWYFEASVDSDAINVTGPELTHRPERGTYKAVWVDLATIDCTSALPAAVTRLVVETRGSWPDDVIEIDER